MIVVLTKFDVWRTLLPGLNLINMLGPHPSAMINCLQMDDVEALSSVCRDLLNEYCREIVTAADSVSDKVLYAPVAAVGWDIRRDSTSGQPNFRAANCEPYGVLVPLLTLLSKVMPKLVIPLRRRLN